MTARCYLDYNASAPLRAEARAAMQSALDLVGNPSSVHADGRAARRRLEQARREVAAACGSQPEEIVFTAGGTEANNLALAGCPPAQLLVSAIEHDSVLEPAGTADRLPVDGEGRLDLDRVQARFERGPPVRLVSVMLVNNETGVIQPVAALAALAHRHGCRVHCDASQALGRIPVDKAALGVDLLTLSAHKIGGPKGAGALVVGAGVPLSPTLRGGGQETRRRAGTENVPALAGFGGAAAAASEAAQGDERTRIGRLRAQLEADLLSRCPNAVILGAGAERVVNTTCLAVPNLSSETQVLALDLAGISVSAGAACSSGKVQPSHVLTAMGVAPSLSGSAIRISLGWSTTEAEIERFVAAWTSLYQRHTRLTAVA